MENVLENGAIPLARDSLHELVSNLASDVKNKSEKKISRKGAVREGKGFTLFVSNDRVRVTLIELLHRVN